MSQHVEVAFEKQLFARISQVLPLLIAKEADGLVQYFTTLADYLDNELFGAMLTFDGLTHEQLSVMGRSEYDPDLAQSMIELERRFRTAPSTHIVVLARDRLRDAVTDIHEAAERYQPDATSFLLAVKPTIQELVSNLLTAAELVGSSTSERT